MSLNVQKAVLINNKPYLLRDFNELMDHYDEKRAEYESAARRSHQRGCTEVARQYMDKANNAATLMASCVILSEYLEFDSFTAEDAETAVNNLAADLV